MARRDIVVFGGSGFIGRYVVGRLAAAGWRVTVAVRDPERAAFLQPLGDVGQIVAMRVDVAERDQVAAAMAGAGAAVNLVGILYEKGARTFERVHVVGARNVGEVAAETGARVVHVSSVAASPRSPSAYGRSKAAGEAALRAAVPDATILRPGVVFGNEDGFFNLFGRMAALLPALPLFGGGTTRFQPVYVDDVAAAVATCLERADTAGRTYELGGPSVYTFRRLMEIVRRETGRGVLLVPLPFFVARLQALFLQFLPRPPLTPDQVALMRRDSVVASGSEGFADLGIEPTALEMVVPRYLALYRRGGGAPPQR